MQEEVVSAFSLAAGSSEAGEKRKGRSYVNEQMTCSSLLSRGVPKANNLRHSFRKLWAMYKNPLKPYVQAKSDAENGVH